MLVPVNGPTREECLTATRIWIVTKLEVWPRTWIVRKARQFFKVRHLLTLLPSIGPSNKN